MEFLKVRENFFIGIRKDIEDSDLFTFYLPSKLLSRHSKKVMLKKMESEIF